MGRVPPTRANGVQLVGGGATRCNPPRLAPVALKTASTPAPAQVAEQEPAFYLVAASATLFASSRDIDTPKSSQWITLQYRPSSFSE